jgi:hypothetical protein
MIVSACFFLKFDSCGLERTDRRREVIHDIVLRPSSFSSTFALSQSMPLVKIIYPLLQPQNADGFLKVRHYDKYFAFHYIPSLIGRGSMYLRFYKCPHCFILQSSVASFPLFLASAAHWATTRRNYCATTQRALSLNVYCFKLPVLEGSRRWTALA